MQSAHARAADLVEIGFSVLGVLQVLGLVGIELFVDLDLVFRDLITGLLNALSELLLCVDALQLLHFLVQEVADGLRGSLKHALEGGDQ